MGKNVKMKEISQKEYFKLLNTAMTDKAIKVFEGFVNDTIDAVKSNPSLDEKQKVERIRLINLKKNHTLRCLDMARTIMKSMNFDDSWIAVESCIIIFHDIARFMEAEYCGSFTPDSLKDFYKAVQDYQVKEHAGWADLLLFKKGAIKDFFKIFGFDNNEIERFSGAIEDAISQHQKDDKNFPEHLKLQLDMPEDQELINSNLFELILNPYNDSEIMDIIKASLAQIMKDVDKLDILNQHLTGEFPIMRKTIMLKTYTRGIINKKGKDNEYRNYLPFNKYIEHWGLNVEEFLSINPNFDRNAQDKLASLGLIDMATANEEIKDLITRTAIPKMPMDKLDPAKLAVPNDILEMLYSGKMQNTELTQLMGRYDYVVPFTDMCWRWGAFLGALNFTESLKVVKDSNLVWKIYEQYSDECKPYAIEFFSFVQNNLIDDALDRGKMYIKKGTAA